MDLLLLSVTALKQTKSDSWKLLLTYLLKICAALSKWKLLVKEIWQSKVHVIALRISIREESLKTELKLENLYTVCTFEKFEHFKYLSLNWFISPEYFLQNIQWKLLYFKHKFSQEQIVHFLTLWADKKRKKY